MPGLRLISESDDGVSEAAGDRYAPEITARVVLSKSQCVFVGITAPAVVNRMLSIRDRCPHHLDDPHLYPCRLLYIEM